MQIEPHNEKRITVVNYIFHFTGQRIVLKRGAVSRRAWLKTGDGGWIMYSSVDAARESSQMREAMCRRACT